MSKIVQVSDDDATYYTLPGGSGEHSNEAANIDDTIFGEEYKSTQTGLIEWSVEGQAVYKGYAGYLAKVMKAGTATAMVGEAMTLVSGKTYRVTSTTKRVLDPADTFIVYDGGVDHTADVLSYNYLFGEVTFDPSYTVAGAVTITGDYLPMATLGKANTYTLTQTAEAVENTDFATSQANSGHRTYEPGLRTVQVELGGFYDVDNGFKTLMTARTTIIVEINPDGSGNSLARGFFKVATQGQSGDVGAIEEESVTLVMQVPSSDYLPYGWYHASGTTLHTSIQKCLEAWLDETLIHVKYLYDGTNGIKGESVVTEITMSGGLDNMNEFTASFQGSGAKTTIGTG